ncbi:flagellar basal body L-ring protein FlgH [Desulfovibrio intestinalis]|uniref:Flagellar L-ring protein n=1 Tax=Desulfovibrio intestinalis TaxID=58621 RepID=A0A7W8FG95_9BACT|nr:flagellar basal body L-ring protein FlgH [Desulfovibrio intestinalis]MBB5144768.1 flagellar L-ring protein precursor FlgH [Desulfovibrio intestinalis]
MQARHIIPVLALVFALCAACGGGPRKHPALQPPVTDPQEYRQETNAANNPGSLFAASEQDTLFSDSRARRVGDIVVVKLVENTKAQNKAETTAKKGGANDYQVGALFGQSSSGFIPFLNVGPTSKVGVPALSTTSTSDLSATGKTKRENYVTTSLAARVLRVLPGGLLQIEGAREIRVNEETEYMVVRGMVRSKDVSADNSVLSTQIADASIEYYGRGVLADKQKPGWFTRLMDNVWPF